MTAPAFRVVNVAQRPDRRSGGEQSQHFLGQTVHLAARIRDHIERLDNGAAYAIDDLAVTMRAMLSPHTGNNVLGRLNQFSKQNFEIQLSKPASAESPHFSVGSLPVAHPGAGRDGARWVPVTKLSSQRVLRVVHGTVAKNYTWGSFLDTYANKWGGAHIDKEIPTHLRIVDVYETGGHLLSAYLIRTAATQVWLMTQAMLAEVFESLVPEVEGGTLLVVGAGADAQELGSPRDVSASGELQFLDYTGATTEILGYYAKDRPVTMTISGGGQLTHTINIRGPETEETAAPDPTTRARTPMPPTQLSFSEGKTMLVNGHFRTYDEAADPGA